MSQAAVNAYRAAKASFNARIASLGGNNAQALEYMNFLNSLKTLNGAVINGNGVPEVDSYYNQIRQHIEQQLDVQLDAETLALSEDETAARAYIANKEATISRRLFSRNSTGTVGLQEFTRLLHNMEQICKTLDGRTLTTAEKKFKGYYNRLMTIVKQQLTNTDGSLKTVKIGRGYGVDISQVSGINLPLILNRAAAMMAVGSVAQAQGEIGELFVQQALALYHNGTLTGVDRICKGLGEGSGYTIQQVGGDTSHNLYPTGNFSVNGPAFSVQGHRTQDKVDIVVKGANIAPVGFSVKNYANTSQITLLSGNLGPLFNQYVEFMNHYALLKKVYPEGQQNFMQFAKNIAYFHALSGGILIRDTSGQIVTQGKAQYLVVNNSSKATNSFKVYSIKDLATRYLSNGNPQAEAIFNIRGGEEVFEKPEWFAKIWSQLNRSNSHISMLLSSLKT